MLVVLGEHITTQKGYAFKSKWYSDEGHPIVKVTNFTTDSIDIAKLVRIPEDIARHYMKYQLKTNDVVIQTVGSWPSNPASVVGKTIRVPKSANGALLNQNAVRIEPDETIDKGYLYYLLRNNAFKDYIIGTAQGSASQASITLDSIKTYKFDAPTLEKQKRISQILSSFDHLIENNTHRIAILEEMSNMIYREWFVNFRFPGFEDVVMIDSELGLIPDKWSVGKLQHVAEFVGGGTTTKASYVSDGYPAFSAAGPDGMLPDFEINGPGVVLSAVGARCGRTFRASNKWSSIANTIKILPKNTQLFAWLYHTTGDPRVWPKRGSAQPFISINDAREVICLIPPMQLLTLFNLFVDPIFSLQDNLATRLNILVAARDFLIPRLISGEIDVSQLDIEVAA